MRLLLVLALAVSLAILANARWMRKDRSNQTRETSFVGKATDQLATAIFQRYMYDSENIAFSPLGNSAILAILAEGATGETREELVKALHLPQDPNLTRNTYKFIMERLKSKNEYKDNQPELKKIVYIYKNFTINDDYKKILVDYYLTEIRSVERYNGELDLYSSDVNGGFDRNKEIIVKNTENKKNEEIPEQMPLKETTEKFISFVAKDTPEKVDISAAKNIQEKIKLVKTYPKKEKSREEKDTMVPLAAQNQARSLRVLMGKDDIRSSIFVNRVGMKSNKTDDTPLLDSLNNHPEDEKAPLWIDLKQYPFLLYIVEKLDKLVVAAGYFLVDMRNAFYYPRTSPSIASSSVMVLFNGMYFRGAWKKPFDSVELGIFYISKTEKKEVPMMKTKGTFKTAIISELESEAIELPYDGGRYSLLLMVPWSHNGLARLAVGLSTVSLFDIQEALHDEELQVSIPTFDMENTTEPIAALDGLGVSNIFSRYAELSGVSSTEGLYVQKLIQHVAVRVDNTKSSASELTAGNQSAPSDSLKSLPLHEKPARRLNVERPFLFYIMDRLDKLIVLAGKVTDPQQLGE